VLVNTVLPGPDAGRARAEVAAGAAAPPGQGTVVVVVPAAPRDAEALEAAAPAAPAAVGGGHEDDPGRLGGRARWGAASGWVTT